jgi:hypothetical protein
MNFYLSISAITLFSIIQIISFGQNTLLNGGRDHSPDGKFELIINSKQLSDGQSEWKYWLISKQLNNSIDTTLLITTITHDNPRPAVFWSKDSKKMIYQDQSSTDNNDIIKIYRLDQKRKLFQAEGIIFSDKTKYFDQSRDLVFFFKKVNRMTYDLIALNINTLKIYKLKTLKSSGDSLTGIPIISEIDFEKREIEITIENGNFQTEKKTIKY